MKVVLALLAGALVAGGAVIGWQRFGAGPCQGRCGDGTRCDGERCVVAAAPPPSTVAPPEKGSRRRRRSAGASTASSGGAAAPALAPGDLKTVSQGDDLRARATHLDLSDDSGGPRELDQDQLDEGIAPVRDAIADCLVEAAGDLPVPRVRVEVVFRVAASGRVDGVRVSGPQVLVRNGVASCVRPKVLALRFPHSGGATVATYPFELK